MTRERGGGEDGALVREVVVEDALAEPGLGATRLHGEAGVAVLGQAADGRARTICSRGARRHPTLGLTRRPHRHVAGSLILIGRSTN